MFNLYFIKLINGGKKLDKTFDAYADGNIQNLGDRIVDLDGDDVIIHDMPEHQGYWNDLL